MGHSTVRQLLQQGREGTSNSYLKTMLFLPGGGGTYIPGEHILRGYFNDMAIL